MRLAEGPLRPGIQRGMAGDGVNGRDLQRFFFIQGRQQAGQAAGQQGFAGAGRAGKQQVVLAGRGNQQGALGGLLALDIGQVRVGGALSLQALGLVGRQRRLPARLMAESMGRSRPRRRTFQ